MIVIGWLCVVMVAMFCSFVSFTSWMLHSVFSSENAGRGITIFYLVVAIVFWYFAIVYCPFTIVMA